MYSRSPALLLALAGVVSCGGGGDAGKASAPVAPVTVASVVLSGVPADSAVMTGAKVRLSATARDAAGAAVSATITWTSSNIALARVVDGEVEGVSSGSVAIFASAGGQGTSVAMTVRDPLAAPAAGASPVTTTAAGGAVSITIPPGAAPAGAALGVAPATGSLPSSPEFVSGSAFTFTPQGTQFASPVTLSLRFNPTGMSATERDGLGLYLATELGWQRVAGSGVSATQNIVTGSITHFSTYAVLRRAAPASISFIAGAGQTGEPGAALPVSPVVRVLDANGMPIEGVFVAFSITAGTGSLTALSATTNADGRASPGTWRLGADGPNAISATVVGLLSASLSANALSSLPPINVSSTSVTFAWIQNLIAPSTQSITVSTTAGRLLTSVAVSGLQYTGGATGWLTITTSGATTPVTLGLSVAIRDLPVPLTVGTHTATFNISAIGSSNSPQRVTVSYVVSPPTPVTSFLVYNVPTLAVSDAGIDPAPTVQLFTASGASAIGAQVDVSVSLASGSGTLSGGATRNSAGSASVAFPGLRMVGTGTHVLRFTVGNLAPQLYTIELAPSTPALTLVSGSGQFGYVGAPLEFPLRTRVLDPFGAGLPGLLVGFQSGGGTTDPLGGVYSDASGYAAVAFTPSQSGTLNVRATILAQPLLFRDFTVYAASHATGTASSIFTVSANNLPANGTNTVEIGFYPRSPDGVLLPADCLMFVSMSKTGPGTLSSVAKNTDTWCKYVATVTAPSSPGTTSVTITLNGTVFFIPVTITWTSLGDSKDSRR